MPVNTKNRKLTQTISKIEAEMITRYYNRLQKFGNDPRTLGWDTKKSQITRFQAVLDLIKPEGKEIIDIGCGFADLYGFMIEQGIRPSGYLGLDVNADLLEVAKTRFPQLRYEKRNLLIQPFLTPVADLGVMLGLLNFRLKEIGNYNYARKMIEVAFSSVRQALVVDFLSNVRAPDYPKESLVFYFEPEKILRLALSITPNVVLKHNYVPIPQREFMLLLYKNSCA